jgi:hypothetical protein
MRSEAQVKGIIEKAIKDYESKWEAKAQSRKVEESDDQEDSEGKE